MSVKNQIAGTALGLSATLASNELATSALFTALDNWLSKVTTPVGFVEHVAAGLTTQALSVIQAPLAGRPGQLGNLTEKLSSVLQLDPETASYVNRLWELFRQPNIEGIVVFAESESTTRHMDVSTSPLVVQSNLIDGVISRTTYVTDNAVPQPRTWQLNGHLSTVMTTDHYFVIKPSLLLQRDYLDNCMRTRKPVVFKAYDNNFHRVLITDMKTAWDSKSMNTMSIQLSMVEYVPIEVGTEIPNSAAMSISKYFTMG